METVERDKECGLWREIRNVGCGDTVEICKECGL